MTAPQHLAWNRPRDGAPLPCHPSHCPTCGHAISIEVHAGVTRDYCHGCARNRARAEMGLPALNYTVPVTYVEAPKHNGRWAGQPVRARNVGGPKPRKDRGIQRIHAKLPRFPHTACTQRELAQSLGVSEQAVNICLLRLEKAGKAARHKPVNARRAGWMWYRAAA
jgi:hypothetical protein